MPRYDGWTVTVTYETEFFSTSLGSFSKDAVALTVPGHGDIVKIVMV